MLALLPILTLCLCILALTARLRCWRARPWGMVLVGATEALSAVHQLTSPAVTAAWLLALVACAGLILARRREFGSVRAPRSAPRPFPALLAALGSMLLVLEAIAEPVIVLT